jgi:hypothetical protein
VGYDVVFSKNVKLVEVRAVSAGRWPAWQVLVSTNSAPILPISDVMALTCTTEKGPDLSRRHDAVTEVHRRLGHPLVVGDYCSEISA